MAGRTILILILLLCAGVQPSAAQIAKEAPPLPKTQAERRALGVLDTMPRHLSVPPEDGRLLRILAESIGAKQVVELGTSTGFSGIWFALALRSTGGHLTTFEVDEQRGREARGYFQKAGVDDLVTVIIGDGHAEAPKIRQPIDLLFIDADKEGYLDYLTKLLPLVRAGGLILAHNMHYPSPDPRFVRAITANPDLETVFLNMQSAGISLTLKKR